MKNDKIKSLRQKEDNNTYSSPIPIGANGINVDMLSTNNLEEEFHLGSPCVTNFTTDAQGNMTITEEYKINDSQNKDYYVMITTFEVQNNETIIIQKLYYYLEENVQELQKTKKITFINSELGLTIKEVIEE